MSSLGFLIDENVSPVIATQLRLREPKMPVVAVGQSAASPKGTPDPDLLCWLKEHDHLLVTNNHASMPEHLHNHLAIGRYIPGILVTPVPVDSGLIIEELILV
jgi:hypothetical protein